MEAKGFSPDIQLEYTERALIAQTVATQGYAIIHRIMRSEVDKFIVNLINADEDDEQAIVAKHKLAKSAAQFYQAVTDRINHEVHQYVAATQQNGPPVDPTEGLIDMGAPPSTLRDVEADGQPTGEEDIV